MILENLICVPVHVGYARRRKRRSHESQPLRPRGVQTHMPPEERGTQNRDQEHLSGFKR